MAAMAKITFLIIILINVFPVLGQNISQNKENIYSAYVTGDLQLWIEIINDLEESWNNTMDFERLEELVMAQYGYIAFCLKEDEKEEGRSVLISANNNLQILMSYYPERADLIALKAAFTGFEMGFNPLKAIFLASRAKELTGNAYNMDKDNIICISVKANQLNFTPPIFGGSTEESIPYYNMIISKYNSGEENKYMEWRYINTLVILAQSYEKLELYNKACSTYEIIIAEDPEISWIKNKLYPDCLRHLR